MTEAAEPRPPRRIDAMGWSVLAAAALAVLLPLLMLEFYAAMHGTPWEGWAVRAFFCALGWAGLGGVLMTTRTQNPWWLCTTLVALVVPAVGVWFASQLGTLTLH